MGIILLGKPQSNPLIRPLGTPTLDLGNPHNDGLLLFVYDTGEGEYAILADCNTGQSAPNDVHFMAPPLLYGVATIGGGPATNPATLPDIEDSAYGPAFRFTGAAQDSSDVAGFTVWTWEADAIRDAQNLYNKGTGAAFSYEAYFQFDGVNAADQGVIFGRTANGWSESLKSCSAVLAAGGVTAGNQRKVAFGFYCNGASSSVFITSPTEYATGALIHAVASCKNDSAGSATVNLIVNGVTVATASGQAIRDLTYQTEDSLEGQVMIGSSYHIYADHVSGCLNGKMLAGGIYNREIIEAEALARYQARWTRLS